MKTLKEVKDEINEILGFNYKTILPSQVAKQQAKNRKRLKFLILMKCFLEGDPSKTLLRGQLEKVENTIEIAMTRFSFQQFQNMSAAEVAKKRKDYEKAEDIPKMKEQVKVLKFLLKNNAMPKRERIDTSIEAYHSLDVNQLNKTYKTIIETLSKIGEGTFEDIAATAKEDKAKIWKRLSELERMQVVYRPGEKKVLKSGRNGYVWMIREGYVVKTEVAYRKEETTAAEHASKIIKLTKPEYIPQSFNF